MQCNKMTGINVKRPHILTSWIAKPVPDIEFICFICHLHHYKTWPPESCCILQHPSPCKGCWEIWLSHEQSRTDHNKQWWELQWQSWSAQSPPHPQRSYRLENVCYKTNKYMCRMPSWGTEASAGLADTHLSWQTCLGLDGKSWNSAPILVSIQYSHPTQQWCPILSKHRHDDCCSRSLDLQSWIVIYSGFLLWNVLYGADQVDN